ncbi:MAG: SPOR domain-containing protein [Bacteroidia bacterium]
MLKKRFPILFVNLSPHPIMNPMRYLTFILACLCTQVALSQTATSYETEDVAKYRDVVVFEEPQVTVTPDPVPTPPSESVLNKHFTDGRKVFIDADQNLDAFVAAHVEVNQQVQTTEGYRIQIFAGSRDGANSARARLLNRYPELEAYVVPIEPNYRVRVGNFTSRAEAQRICDMVRSSFPAAWVIKDKIKLN